METIKENEISTDSYQIEKAFREKRKITIPEFGVVPSRKGKPSVENLRIVLQNWHTPKEIDNNLIKRQAVYEWRWKIKKYLQGDESRVCDRLKPLIEEYKDFLLDETKKSVKNSIEIPKYTHNKGEVSDKVLVQWKKVLDNWDCPQALTTEDIGIASLKKYRTTICKVLKGEKVFIPEKVMELINQYKDKLTLPPRVKNRKVTMNYSNRKTRPDKLQHVIDYWNNPRDIDRSYISSKMIDRYRTRVYQFIRGNYEGIPKEHLEILKANQEKLKDVKLFNRHTKFDTKEQVIQQVKKGIQKMKQQTEQVEENLYPTVTEEQLAKNRRKLIDALQEEEEKTIRSQVSKELQDSTVTFIAELKKLGVTEFTIKF